LPDAQENPVTMQRTQRNCFQNEEIECAGKKLSMLSHRHP
jgi:hypothetical protein